MGERGTGTETETETEKWGGWLGGGAPQRPSVWQGQHLHPWPGLLAARGVDPESSTLKSILKPKPDP